MIQLIQGKTIKLTKSALKYFKWSNSHIQLCLVWQVWITLGLLGILSSVSGQTTDISVPTPPATSTIDPCIEGPPIIYDINLDAFAHSPIYLEGPCFNFDDEVSCEFGVDLNTTELQIVVS